MLAPSTSHDVSKRAPAAAANVGITSIKIPFAALRRAKPRQPAAWTAKDLLLL
jgi:hypothetical protein